MRRKKWLSVLFLLQVRVYCSRYRSNFFVLVKGSSECLHPCLILAGIAIERFQDMFFLQEVGMSIPCDILLVVHDRVMERERCFNSEDDVFRNCPAHSRNRFGSCAIPGTQF